MDCLVEGVAMPLILGSLGLILKTVTAGAAAGTTGAEVEDDSVDAVEAFAGVVVVVVVVVVAPNLSSLGS